ncbi:MAG: hypothetical protein DI551_00520, partial [Micavibrio aeruginosavorus]
KKSMLTRFPKALMGIALSLAAITLTAGEAKAYANDYCREYTRTVTVGNRVQDAYGTACLQPDGSWMIVGEGLNNNVPYQGENVTYIVNDNNRYVVPPRVVYYERAPSYYRTQPAPLFVWYSNNNRRGYDKHYNYGWRGNKHWDRHDRDDNRGRGHR